MPLVKNASSNLAQGVSQQAESQRYPSQATEQINAYSSPIKGLVKRPPSSLISKVNLDTTGENNTFVHTINRDSSERYVLAIDKQTSQAVTTVSHSNNTVTFGTSVPANTAVRFKSTEEDGQLPGGIIEGKTYYTKTTGTTTALSKTEGGADINIGQISISDLNIESVKHVDGRWVDGVFAVTLAAGHGLEEGDLIRINGLKGDAGLILNADEGFVLRTPDYDMALCNSSGEATAWPANKFLLGRLGGDSASLEDNLGYVVDDQWKTDGDNDGWNAFGNMHWTLWKDTTLIHNINGTGGSQAVFNRIRYNGTDADEFDNNGVLGGSSPAFTDGWQENLSDFNVGDLVRLGQIRNPDTAIRARIKQIAGPTNDHTTDTSKTGHDHESYDIVFDDYIKVSDLVDSPSDTTYTAQVGNGTGDGSDLTNHKDANPPWVKLVYWGNTTSTVPSARASNPRQFRKALDNGGTPPANGTDPNDISGAYIGSNWTLAADGGFSMLTGGIRVYDVVNKEEKTVNIDSGLDYITSTTDPASQLSAVTVADYTFLVNKTATVVASGDIKYTKNYEAFITTRAADYGKRYTIKVGGEVNKTYGDAAAEPSLIINGINADGTEVPVAKLVAKEGHNNLNGFSFRLLQNWKYSSSSIRVVPTRLSPASGVYPTDKQYTDLLPPEEHRINKHVGIDYSESDRRINIWVNFKWAKINSVPWQQGNRTTVQHLIDAVASHEMGDKWEVKELDENGDVQTGTSAASALYFFDTYLQARGSKHEADYKLSASFSSRMYLITWYMGPDETVSEQTKYGFAVAGYLSPSAGTNVTRSIYTGAGRQAATSGQDFGDTKIEDGEFFYKSPRWTGTKEQQAIGTERIAEMLASNSKILAGVYSSATAGVDPDKKANGLPISKNHHLLSQGEDADDKNPQEDCLGLTWQYWNNSNDPKTTPGYLAQYSGQGIVDGGTKNWSVTQEGYTIALKNPKGTKFAIQVSDDLGGTGLKLTYFEVDESSDLPDVCRHGHVVKVVGDAREEADDYYLRFESDSQNPEDLSHGRWVECVGYDVPYKFDESTMPVGLIRESDGTFTLKQLSWGEREAGDEKSNPFPSFTGNTITDVFLFRNRLGFLSGENIIFSESGEYFNFFRTTTAALLDSAPIDVTASTNKVSKLHSALPYNERLIVFSDQTQFVLDAEPFLSVKTVTLSPANEIDNLTGVKPVVSGNSVYYGFARTGYSGVGELGVSVEDADQMEVTDASGHIPKYIKGNIRKLVSATNNDVICAITDDATSATLYVHKYFTNAQNQKVQAAWFKYTFGTPNSDENLSDYITDISFIDNTLYMIIRRGGTMYLEAITFEDDVKDIDMDYKVLLDQRVDKADVTINGTTSITMPTGVSVTANTRLVTDKGVQLSSSTTGSTFTPQSISDSPSAVAVPTDNFFIGVPYTMEYTFSQPFLKSDKVTETGRYQIQRAYLEYANARSFTVDVTHNPKMSTPNKQTVTNTYANDVFHNLLTGTADLQEGFFKFAVQERNDRLQIVIKNDTPYPSDFLSIDYEARAFSRGSRWRG